MLSLSEHCPDGIRFMSDFFVVAYFYGCFFLFSMLATFCVPIARVHSVGGALC